jgi:hypothetical protein
LNKLGDESEDVHETKNVEECWGYNFSFLHNSSLVVNFGDKWTAKLGFRKIQTETKVYSNVQSPF